MVSGSVTAQLPPEIWRLILRRATHVPELLATSWDYDPKDQIWEDWPEEKLTGGRDLNEVMDIKCTIVRVCREWRDIGIEFLYEALAVQPPDQTNYPPLCALIRVLTSSTAASPAGCFGYGWWTKRITCQYRLFSDDHIEHLFALLEQCHNLQTFTFSAEESTPSEAQARLARLLESRFPHSLRRVEIYMDMSAGFTSTDVIPRIAGLTSFGAVVADDTPNNIDAAVFRNITTLSINLPSYLTTFPSQWDFPSMTTLTLSNISSPDVNALVPFLKRHQNTLLHLFVSTAWGRTSQLPMLIASAPRLRSLALDKTNLGILGEWRDGSSSSNTILLPILTYLGITYYAERQGSSSWTQDSLNDVLERGLFPDLKVIRVLSHTNPISPHSTWSGLTERCGKYGIRLENSRGDLNSDE